jgi:hypothetical protein
MSLTENPQSEPPLLGVEDFIATHNPPVNMRWTISKHYPELVEAGALLRIGRKLLISPQHFWEWLRERGRREAEVA